MNWLPLPEHELSLAYVSRQVDEICDRFEAAWKAGQRPRVEDYLADAPETDRQDLVQELNALEVAYRGLGDEGPKPEDYRALGPMLDRPEMTADFPTQSGDFSDLATALPARFGRYRVTAQLGTGGFGVVYHGYDEELQRQVAIKVIQVPHPGRRLSPESADAYLAEGRMLATLDHPGIVPVYDVGRTDDGACYLVSKLVSGSDLAKRLRQGRLSPAAAAELVACVAEALHHAHQRGLVHRDIKPANILLDAKGKPILADFGLALREEDFGQGPAFAGTIPYMSPEQARGEGPQLSPCSDIYSLGIVFYELLTGRRPFRAGNRGELLQQIQTAEPCPPSHIDPAVPMQLERICLKMLRKSPEERYRSAHDLAKHLRRWLAQNPGQALEISNVSAAESVCDTPVPEYTRNESSQLANRPTQVLAEAAQVPPRKRRRKVAVLGALAAAAAIGLTVALLVKERPRYPQRDPNDPPEVPFGVTIPLLKPGFEPKWGERLFGTGTYGTTSGDWLTLHSEEIYHPLNGNPTYIALFDASKYLAYEFAVDLMQNKTGDLVHQNYIGIFFGWREYPADGIQKAFTVQLNEKPALNDKSGRIYFGTMRIIEPRLPRHGEYAFYDFLPEDSALPLDYTDDWHRVCAHVDGQTIRVSVDSHSKAVTMAWIRKYCYRAKHDPAVSPQGKVGIWICNGVGNFRNATFTALPPTPGQ